MRHGSGAHHLALLVKEVMPMVIKGQADIQIFISDTGYICLKQRNGLEGDQVIEFAPAYGSKVADAIGSLQEFAQTKFEKNQPADD
jgi:hypothetical protein